VDGVEGPYVGREDRAGVGEHTVVDTDELETMRTSWARRMATSSERQERSRDLGSRERARDERAALAADTASARPIRPSRTTSFTMAEESR